MGGLVNRERGEKGGFESGEAGNELLSRQMRRNIINNLLILSTYFSYNCKSVYALLACELDTLADLLLGSL